MKVSAPRIRIELFKEESELLQIILRRYKTDYMLDGSLNFKDIKFCETLDKNIIINNVAQWNEEI